MKEFSEYEKKILSKLVEIEEIPGGLNVLGNIIDFELYPNFYIKLNLETDCPVIIAKSYIDKIEIVNDKFNFEIDNDTLIISVELDKFNDNLKLDTLTLRENNKSTGR
ncbi:MAG: hypothetical protein KAR19_09055 [Bacteroidales bacterium]|nr:hypothetical protein [Bacteroidales bacterium]